MMTARLRIVVLVAVVCPSPALLMAQGGGMSTLDLRLIQNRWILAGKVTTVRGDPISAAKVDVEPLTGSGGFRSLITDLQGRFQTEYVFNADLVKELSVTLTVT